MINYKLNCIVLCSIASLQIGWSVKCYVCSDMTSLSACKDPFLRNVDIMECWNDLSCGKLKMTKDPGNFSRGCMAPDHCKKKKPDAYYCSTCDTHLCNSTSYLKISKSLYTNMIIFIVIGLVM